MVEYESIPVQFGGWCWNKVAPLLRAAGHVVYTPTLTGLGERAHLASPGIGLGTHVDDVVNVLLFEDLDDVILLPRFTAAPWEQFLPQAWQVTDAADLQWILLDVAG